MKNLPKNVLNFVVCPFECVSMLKPWPRNSSHFASSYQNSFWWSELRNNGSLHSTVIDNWVRDHCQNNIFDQSITQSNSMTWLRFYRRVFFIATTCNYCQNYHNFISYPNLKIILPCNSEWIRVMPKWDIKSQIFIFRW